MMNSCVCCPHVIESLPSVVPREDFLLASVGSICVFVLSALGYYLNRAANSERNRNNNNNGDGGSGDEDKENARSQARQKDRRMWYEYYLKPFSMVSEYQEVQSCVCAYA